MRLLAHMYIKQKLEYTKAGVNHLVEQCFLVYINHTVHDAQSKWQSRYATKQQAVSIAAMLQPGCHRRCLCMSPPHRKISPLLNLPYPWARVIASCCKAAVGPGIAMRSLGISMGSIGIAVGRGSTGSIGILRACLSTRWP